MQAGKYRIVDYPSSRVATFDVGKIGRRKHHIAGLIEIDVTEARSRLKELKRRGERVGFTAWLLKVIALTLSEHPKMHALNLRRGKQVVFEDVDISYPVEREINGKRVPLAAMIREVNRKSVQQIYEEIEETIERHVGGAEDFVLTDRKDKLGTRLFFSLPQFLRMLIWRTILRNPFTIRKNMGTAIVSSVGMIGRFPGWVLPKSMHNLSFGVGSIYEKPWVVEGEVMPREILHLTILFDHDAVDGSPAARFIGRLVRNMEKAEALVSQG